MDPAKLPRVRMMWERGDDTLMHAYVHADMLRAFILAVLAGEPAAAPAQDAGSGELTAARAEDARLAGLRHVKQIIEVDYIPSSSIRGYYTDLIEREIARLTAAPREERGPLERRKPAESPYPNASGWPDP